MSRTHQPRNPFGYEQRRDGYLKYYEKTKSTSGTQEEFRTTPLFTLAVQRSSKKDLSDKVAGLALDGGGDVVPSSDESEDETDENETSESDCSCDESDCEDCGIDLSTQQSANSSRALTQYGLLGFDISNASQISQPEPIMLNVNAPNSAFICGSQGSGKSYTVACMLENCLLKSTDTGKIDHPVGGVCFHYDIDSSNSIAETARLCSRGIRTRVLVSRGNKKELVKAYTALEGADKYLTVEDLLLQPRHLSVERMLKLMSVNEGDHVPLYMVSLQRILRQMAIDGRGNPFDYAFFKKELAAATFTDKQTGPLDLRLALLESFMDLEHATKSHRQKNHDIFRCEPGTLTIFDISDPFVDANTACLLFDICLSLVKQNRPPAGLAVVLDEAHKYMTDSPAAKLFTDRLLTSIREQRHNATRVIIATQEPTISEKLMELASVTIVHRFTSPTWFTAIKNHLGGASVLLRKDAELMEMFERIIGLGVGESLVFSPASFLLVDQAGRVGKLGSGVVKMKTRIRRGADGGQSVLAGGRGEDIQGSAAVGAFGGSGGSGGFTFTAGKNAAGKGAAGQR